MMNWTRMTWNGSSGWGIWLVVGLVMVVFWVAVVTAVALAVRAARARRDPGRPPAGADAGQILDQRFARGELTEQEYTHRRDLLHAV